MEQLKVMEVWLLEEVKVRYLIKRYFVNVMAKILLPWDFYKRLFFQSLVFRHISKC